MKNIVILLVCALAYCFEVQAQKPIPHSRTGFEVEKLGKKKRKKETVTYK